MEPPQPLAARRNDLDADERRTTIGREEGTLILGTSDHLGRIQPGRQHMNHPPLRLTSPDEQPGPRVDELSEIVVREAIDELAKLRTLYWLGESSVHLHALASLIAQAQRRLPAAIHDARDQGHTWTEIGQLLNLSPRTAARRYWNAQ